jgi:hypothetical protein
VNTEEDLQIGQLNCVSGIVYNELLLLIYQICATINSPEFFVADEIEG